MQCPLSAFRVRSAGFASKRQNFLFINTKSDSNSKLKFKEEVANQNKYSNSTLWKSIPSLLRTERSSYFEVENSAVVRNYLTLGYAATTPLCAPEAFLSMGFQYTQRCLMTPKSTYSWSAFQAVAGPSACTLDAARNWTSANKKIKQAQPRSQDWAGRCIEHVGTAGSSRTLGVRSPYRSDWLENDHVVLKLGQRSQSKIQRLDSRKIIERSQVNELCSFDALHVQTLRIY